MEKKMKKTILIATLVSSVSFLAADVDTSENNCKNVDNCYVGLGLGYGSAHNKATSQTALGTFPSKVNTNHMLFNVLLGYKHTFPTNVILGVEFDNTFSLNKNSKTSIDFDYIYKVKNRAWTPSFGVLVGYAFNKASIYVKGGISFPSVRHKKDPRPPLVSRGDDFDKKCNKTVPFVGAALDYRLNKKWAVRLDGTYTFKQKMSRDELIMGYSTGYGKCHQKRIAVRIMALYSIK